MENYQECYVAFLDILGFKYLNSTKCFEEVREVFVNITKGKAAKMALYRSCNDEDKELYRYNKSLDDIFIKTISDSIIIACPCNYRESLIAVIDMCWMIQYFLYECSKPILLRGAIAKGKLYFDNEIIFGKGMIDAYLVQEEISIYPRIIVSQKIVDDVMILESEMITENSKLLNSVDKYFYINCLYQYLESDNFNVFQEKAIKIWEMIQENLKEYQNNKIREKYLWLYEEFTTCIEKICYKYNFQLGVTFKI